MVQYELKIGKEEFEVVRDLTLSKETVRKQIKKLQILYAILSVVSIVWTFIFFCNGHKISGIILLIVAAICIYMIIRGAYRQLKRAMNKVMANKETPAPRLYTINREGVEISSEMGVSQYRWNAFKCWGMIKHYIYLEMIDNKVVLIDRDKLSQAEFDEIKELIGDIPYSQN